MMRLSIGLKILGVLGLGLAAVLTAAWLSYRKSLAYVEANRMVTHTYQVIAELEATYTNIGEAESASRGYVITGQDTLIGLFRHTSAENGDHLRRLRALTLDNRRRAGPVDSLERLAAARFDFLALMIAARRDGGYAAARDTVLAHAGRGGLGPIRAILSELRGDEYDLLRARERERDASITETVVTFAILLLLVCAAFGVMYFFIRRDLAGRRRAEEEIRRTGALLDSIVENIPAMIFMKDAAELRFVRFNKAGEALTGYRREELIGRNDYDFFPKAEADFFTAKDREVLAGAGIVDIPEEPLQTKHRGIRTLHTRKIALAGEAGGAGYLLGISEDITEERRSSALLRESEERHRLLVASVKDYAIFMLTPEGYVFTWNAGAERIKGYREEEIVGKHFSVFYPPEEIARGTPAEALRTAAEQGRYEIENWRIRKDGSRFWANVVISAVRDQTGTLRGFSKVTRDLTERRKTEESIRRLNADLSRQSAMLAVANKELEAFAYSVSHDLRAPLRSMDGFSLALLEDYGGLLDEKGRDYLHRVRNASQRMAQLIDDLLNLSRLSRTEMRREEVDLSSMARAIAADLRRAEPGRSVRFTIPDGITAHGDQRLLRVVLDNLIGNAWKYTGKHAEAEIELGSIAKNGEQVFFVRDDGAGFDMSHTDKLFGAFQRLHRVAEFPGSGIGLATVQRIIHRHGGKVWAEGAVEKGASFYFTLG